MSRSSCIPILLLKTQSQPNDGYQDYFSSPSNRVKFEPIFIPVLSHASNEDNLSKVEHLLRQGTLKSEYGGMIFTSQRAVEGWSSIVTKLDAERQNLPRRYIDPDYFDDSPFPLYVVGPATHKTLTLSLIPLSRILPHLNPTIIGEHTGNGANLGTFMLKHYNEIHALKLFTFYEAPRLPYIPLLGAGGENYSRRRLDRDDERLRKKPLLFLVGEQRRDVIPKTLQDGHSGEARIEVDEVEVYSTTVVERFEDDFGIKVNELERSGAKVVVVVVFSPQGCDSMLQVLGLLGENRRVGEEARRRRHTSGEDNRGVKYVITTIGPTTRDFLMETFSFEADICAATPSPEGLGEGVREFLGEKGLL